MCTSYTVFNRSHGTYGCAPCSLEDSRNSEMDRDLNKQMSEYNNEVYIVNWTTGESVDLRDDVQGTPTAKQGILVRDQIVKNNCLCLGDGFDNMQQANIIPFDQLRMQPTSRDALKNSKLPINQAHDSEWHQETFHIERLYFLKENIKSFFKQDKCFAKYSKNPDCTRHSQIEDTSLHVAWTQGLDILKQKCICQRHQVDLTHRRFNIKPRAENIFTLSAFTYLFRSCSWDSVLPFVSPCSSSISVLQLYVPILPRDEGREREKMFQLQRDNATVDSNNIWTSVTDPTLNTNEKNTTLPVMSILYIEGGHIFLLHSKTLIHSMHRRLGSFTKYFKLCRIDHFHGYIAHVHRAVQVF